MQADHAQHDTYKWRCARSGGIHAGTPRSRPDVDGADPSLKKGLVVAMLAERASKNKAEADK